MWQNPACLIGEIDKLAGTCLRTPVADELEDSMLVRQTLVVT